MFIQQKRFGNRITYAIDCQTDAESVVIPTFTFQPLVENAIIHGLSCKEEGGHIRIRIRENRGGICIAVADNGIGMSLADLQALRNRLRQEETDKTGYQNIGLSNIYKRIHAMYADGKMRIHSREGVGTIISIRIPDERGNGVGE